MQWLLPRRLTVEERSCKSSLNRELNKHIWQWCHVFGINQSHYLNVAYLTKFWAISECTEFFFHADHCLISAEVQSWQCHMLIMRLLYALILPWNWVQSWRVPTSTLPFSSYPTLLCTSERVWGLLDCEKIYDLAKLHDCERLLWDGQKVRYGRSSSVTLTNNWKLPFSKWSSLYGRFNPYNVSIELPAYWKVFW